MNHDKLIRMANQICAFFRSYPEDQAVRGIHDHLVAFWTPGMRAELAGCAADKADGLDPLVTKALSAFQPGRSPIARETAGPEVVGQLGSDAG